MAPAEHDTTRMGTARFPEAEPPRRRPAWAWLIGGAVGAVVIALAAVVLLRDDDRRVRSEAVGRGPTTTTIAGTTTSLAAGPGTTTAGATDGSTATTRPSGPATTQPARVAWEDLRLSLDGLGPVDIGMTPAEASAAAGVQIKVVPEADLGQGCAYARADRGPSDRLFMVVDGRIVRIDVGGRGESRHTLTVSGIGVGSTEEEVERTYPGRIGVQGHPYVPDGHYLRYTPVEPGLKHLSMIFETDGRVVTSFRAGLADPVSWIEGCA